MSNRALDNLRYRSKSAPLEHQLTFNELQNVPLGFKTAMPREPVAEQMSSLEFKNMEGMMFEQAQQASKAIRSEKMTEVLIDHAAAMNEVPRDAMAAGVAPDGRQLPREMQGSAQAYHAQQAQAAAMAAARQQANMLAIQEAASACRADSWT